MNYLGFDTKEMSVEMRNGCKHIVDITHTADGERVWRAEKWCQCLPLLHFSDLQCKCRVVDCDSETVRVGLVTDGIKLN